MLLNTFHDLLNVRLHGAFLVFSKSYIRNFDGLDDSTFMYGEEMFLQMHVLKAGRQLLYTPEYIVYHKEMHLLMKNCW